VPHLGSLGRLVRLLGAVTDEEGEQAGKDEKGEYGQRDGDGQHQWGVEHCTRIWKEVILSIRKQTSKGKNKICIKRSRDRGRTERHKDRI
jgi:hypothetical protein